MRRGLIKIGKAGAEFKLSFMSSNGETVTGGTGGYCGSDRFGNAPRSFEIGSGYDKLVSDRVSDHNLNCCRYK